MVLDLRITHERVGRSSDLSLNGNLRYPNDKDRSLNETATDKILKYRDDYNNNPPHAVAFMPAIASTSGRLHSEFIRLLFLQSHRETDRFFAASGVQIRNLPVEDSFTFGSWCSLRSLGTKSTSPYPRMQLYVLISI